ncbi:enoyl-CoA hydratase/isomerase family protein [Deinococcus cavernae]|uniref:Enoyl-CoA hydratase/isomerase family protein n=1 Tax=Deinococcus cavernae TaxID=2320857 RepID=A0A418UZL2_9DEIO|nr:enoyl-CoA hydratase/isomerase family protein [Deinococcus cavernae]RJF68930.1 enoyl-CoA hydratase/isomerase family protein [Deinococcus cavernae]
MNLVLTENRAHLRILKLNRPEVRNAMSGPMMAELMAALDAAEADRDVRGVIFTGEGSAFCGGLDVEELKAMAARSPEQHRADATAFANMLERIYLFPKPTFAAVNGHAVGAGAGMVCAADFAVQDTKAKVGFTEAKIGFVAAVVAVFVMRQLPEKHARDLLLSARLLGAEEAARMGLVNEAAGEGQALARAIELAEAVTANAPMSLRVTKQMLADAPHQSLQEGLKQAAELNAAARASESLKEGVASFLEKRAADWNAVAER